jgi:hypothetical protein
MSDPITPPPSAGDPTENSTIRQMREALEASQRASREMEDRLKTFEREKLSETERIRAEADDTRTKLTAAEGELTRLRDENGRYVSAVQSTIDAELATVPEDKRAVVETLAASASTPDQKLAAIRAAKILIGAPPVVAGTPSNPGRATPVIEPPAPQAFDPLHPPSLAGVFGRRN